MYKSVKDLLITKKAETVKGVTFIYDANRTIRISYQELYYKSREIMNKLFQLDLKKGDEVLLQFEDNYDFIIVFWACILGDLIPIPLSESNTQDNNEKILNIFNMLKQPKLIVSDKRYHELIGNFQDSRASLINLEEVKNVKLTVEYQICEEVEKDQLAMIQFSSGSTGDPKGVFLSNLNLLESLLGMEKVASLTRNDTILSWLPLSHNMGLICMHMTGLFSNFDTCLMKTELFLMNPGIWMEKVSEYRATITGSPNFGFMLYLKYLMTHKPQLDLSNVRFILNGAEPIAKELCMKFMHALSVFGIKQNTLLAAYGLSECTVSVAATELAEDIAYVTIDGSLQNIGEKVQYIEKDSSSYSLDIIPVGYALYHVEIRIADDNNNILEENIFGHIQVRGSIVTKGYYGNPEDSRNLFTNDGWLITGDTGFIRKNQLYICGRAKDIIFVNGKNYYPQDIEKVILQTGDVEECVVAGIHSETEARDLIVTFIKTGSENLMVDELIRKSVMEAVNIKIDDIVVVDNIPKSANGKLQRYKLVEQYQESGDQYLENDTERNYSGLDKNRVKVIIHEDIKKILGYTIDDPDKSLLDYGINSTRVIELNSMLENSFGIRIPVSTLFDYPTVNKLADYILDIGRVNTSSDRHQEYLGNEDIAIVGIGCRFPQKLDGVESFFNALLQGHDGISKVPQERFQLRDYSQSLDIPLYGGFLDDISFFDTKPFDITPVEAKHLDPQQRLLLEATYEAFQHANIDIKSTKGQKIGVYVGISTNDYAEITVSGKSLEEIDNYMVTGNMNSMAAGRIGYTFDWKGPMLSIDTACSSSLVSVYEAVDSLKNRKCDAAVAGGVNVILSPRGYVGLSKMNALSLDGYCKTFDDSADGYVRSEGCGMVLLKRLTDAERNHDHVIAVIKGGAVNHDGRSSGLTAPNGLAQYELLENVFTNYNLNKNDVKYIETHGTGTQLGDPQEVHALARVFAQVSSKILLGSVKSNIGHTESAAGIAGLIKVALSLSNRIIPKNIHFKTPNHFIDWDSIPFEVNRTNTILETTESDKILACISSFGLSGTNCFLVVEDYKNKALKTKNQNPIDILTVSSFSKDRLIKDLEKFSDYLKITDELIDDICLTSNRARSSGKYRIGISVADKQEAIDLIALYLRDKRKIGLKQTEVSDIAFVCADYNRGINRYGHKLYETNHIFREAICECELIVKDEIKHPLIDIINSGNNTYLSQILSTICIQYGVYRILQTYGVIPQAVIGYGIGEYTAAYVAGIMTLQDTLKMGIYEGHLKDEGTDSNSKKIIVYASVEKITQIIDQQFDFEIVTVESSIKTIAIVRNSCHQEFLNKLLDAQVRCSVIGNTYSIEELQNKIPQFENFLANITFSSADIKFATSSLCDGLDTSGQNAREAWASRLVSKSNFPLSFRRFYQGNHKKLIEIGSEAILSAVILQEIDDDELLLLPSGRNGKDENQQIGEVIASLYQCGVEVKLIKNENAKLVKLPSITLRKRKYWV